MYANFFGLRESPFTITPDPRYLYLSRQHEEALAHLLYGTGEEGGFVQLTGEVGTGKTTLVRALLERHLPDVDLALVLNPRQTIVEFVATICDELGVDYPRHSRTLKPVLDALNQHLLATHAAGRQTVLIVDEAQNLSREVLEQVRLLTNLETTRHKLLRIILVGQPELQAVLERHDLRQLAQRITARCHLGPLNASETRDYIGHRLAVADAHIAIFAPAALREVFRASRGLPRLINVICDRALLGAYARGERVVSRATVRQAGDEALARPPRPRLLPAALGVALLLAMSAAAALYHYWPLPWPEGLAPQAAPATGTNPDEAVASLAAEAAVETAPDSAQPLAEQPASESLGAAEPVLSPPRTGGDSVNDSPRQAPSGEAGASPVAAAAMTADEPPTSPTRPATSTPALGPLATALVQGDPLAVTRALVGVWGEAATPAVLATPCESLSARGMRCLQGRMTWDQLVGWDRPALLQLSDEQGRAQPLLLQGLSGEDATVNWGEGPRQLPVAALQAHWSGDATVLWRLPVGTVLIGTGSSGASVRWLRRQLSLFEGTSEPPSAAVDAPFDEALGARVRRFQESQGLRVDGIVGPHTMLRLSNLGPAGGEPRLVARPGES